MIGVRMSEEEYAAIPACRASHVKGLWNGTPAHLRARMTDQPDTDALRIGRAFHCLLLRHDDFAAEFAVSPKFDRRTKAGKADADAFAADAGGRAIVDDAEFATISAMRVAVLESRAARGLLDMATEAETVLTAEWNGVVCKCRADAMSAGILLDVKTTVSAAPRAFARSCAEYLYHVQFAFYRAIMRDYGYDPEYMAIIAVEKSRPNCVACYVLDAADVDAVEDETAALARVWARCDATGEWPGYPDECVPLAMPAWSLARNANS